jgi:hypothetical protein
MTYSGGPNECSYHYVWLDAIVDLDKDGNCPKRSEHFTAGPAADYS